MFTKAQIDDWRASGVPEAWFGAISEGVHLRSVALRGEPFLGQLEPVSAEAEQTPPWDHLMPVILAGGMATRFGGGAKACARLPDGTSLLESKLQRIPESCPVVVVVVSDATREPVGNHAQEAGIADRIHLVTQASAPTFDHGGALFPDGQSPRFAPLGHGSVIDALVADQHVQRELKRGVEALFVSNIDNLRAVPRADLWAMHAAAGHPLSVEVVEAKPGQAGGFVAEVEGRLQLVEGFALSPGAKPRWINTNTYWLSRDVLESRPQLPWYRVEKKVADAPVVQLERLLGDLTAFFPTSFLPVDAAARFFPMKTRKDLAAWAEAGG